jgi:hypothetical protein
MRQKGRIEKGGFLAIVAIEEAKMGQKSGSVKKPANQVVKEIRRATRRQFSAEEEDPPGRRRGAGGYRARSASTFIPAKAFGNPALLWGLAPRLSAGGILTGTDCVVARP